MAQTQQQPPRQQTQAHDEESDEQRRQRAVREEQAARDEAEQATSHMPQPHTGPVHRMSAADVAKEGEKMVRMLFPHPMTLTLPGYKLVHFPAGLQDVPASLAQDYAADFKANNATSAG